MRKSIMTERIRKSRWLVLLVLLFFVGGTYGAYRMIRTDPKLKKVRDLRAAMYAANRDETTPDERQEKWRQLREAMEQLSDQQRKQMRDETAKERIKRQEAEFKRYANMSEQEKTQFLDERIQRSEEARRRREQAQQQGLTAGPADGGTSSARRSGAPNGSATDANGAAEADTARPTPTPEDWDARRKLRLDETTPEFRAMRDNFFADLRARSQQLGLPPRSGRGTP
jgi:hypothetical protein